MTSDSDQKFTMPPFTLATLRSPQGLQAAIGVKRYYYLVDELQPELHSTARTLLDD